MYVTEIDECTSSPCQNNGTCLIKVRRKGFTCHCGDDFDGTTCQCK